jgi:restriction endonuclease S subunit
MSPAVAQFLGSPVDEAVDARRDEFHTTFIAPSLLGDRLTPQSYRPEVVAAILDLRNRHNCNPLAKLAARRIRQGQTPEYGNGGPPCYKLQDVRQILVRSEATGTVTARFAAENRKSAVDSEAVLINRSGGFTIGRAGAYLRAKPVYASDDVFTFIPKRPCDAAFVACFLNSWWGKRCLEAGINLSTGQLKLPQAHVENMPIPEVSPNVQRAIGNKVRKAERLRELAEAEERSIYRSLEDLLGCLDDHDKTANRYWARLIDLSASRLNPTEYHPYALRAIASILSRFKGMALGDCLTSRKDLSGGATPLGARYCDSGIGFLRVQNVKPNRLDRGDVVFIDRATDEELKRSRIREHDIVMTITGFPGIACCVQAEELPLNTNQHSVRFHLKHEWNPFFVAAFLNSPWGKAQITRRATGATRDAIDYPTVLSLVVPSVPRDRQDVIGAHARDYAMYLRQSERYVADAKIDVESLIDGTRDKEQLLIVAAEIETWLAKKPSPDAAARTRGEPTETQLP